MKRRTLLIVAPFAGALLLAGFAAIAVPLMMIGTVFDPGPPAPSDAAMIAHWEKHRGTLDEITEMLRYDPALNRIGVNWSEPEDPERAHVSPERLAKYRELMKRASIINVGRGHRSIYFGFHASGLSVSGFVAAWILIFLIACHGSCGRFQGHFSADRSKRRPSRRLLPAGPATLPAHRLPV